MSVDPNASNAAPSRLPSSTQNGHSSHPTEVEEYPVVVSPLPGKQRSVADYFAHRAIARPQIGVSLIVLIATGIIIVGFVFDQVWIILAGSLVAIILSIRLLIPTLKPFFLEFMSEEDRSALIGSIGAIAAVAGGLKLLGVDRAIAQLYTQLNWDAIGALGEVFGALGQILIAILAVYVAWRQYVISKDLTIQQNTITQQQTIDTYFQGISDLVLDEDGLLEDWPQERAIAEGRTAAILSSVDGAGKAKILRFLSSAKLLTPLQRDQRLGRAMLDGSGGYAEDRVRGVRVIDLGVMLAGADLSRTDLRWTDMTEANLIRADLSFCDLVKTNFARTILVSAKLQGADFTGTRFFYGDKETATPRSRTEPPNYKTGVHTGAVIEGADFTDAQDLSESQRYYCCAWGGSRSRGTIPGGCEGIPNKLGR
ncbi:MAG: pentapeptide repeat-containing protein [Myxacorys californica WJT36-NPBG1]|jgi:uncharacterized protein YjbI with pentapeptide repeats|nr:pentapeptide repeat-containing protein [Myxacorys californica WJT36-NPBG1]